MLAFMSSNDRHRCYVCVCVCVCVCDIAQVGRRPKRTDGDMIAACSIFNFALTENEEPEVLFAGKCEWPLKAPAKEAPEHRTATSSCYVRLKLSNGHLTCADADASKALDKTVTQLVSPAQINH